ncbi:MAG: permease [Pseudomonadota bacterium]
MRINKRVLILLTLIVATATVFWTGSRYPSLDQKAIMGGSAALEDPLAFEASLQIQPNHGTLQRIAYTTVNWIETNLEGMAFGLFIGACLLTLIGMISVRGTRNGFANTMLGAAIGTPLGVCVNCSAPVAKGMHDGGARLETTLATMFSSPTLNIVVLTMLFSMFPIYLIGIKLALTLIFIFIFVPLLSRYVFKEERAPTYDDSVCAMPPPAAISQEENLLSAARGTAIVLAKNLGYLVIRTVPLMLLAGFLGAVVANVVPLAALVDHEATFITVFLIGLIGIFLPVPVAFDIVVVAILVAAGAPVIYSMTLLFTLGIFSIYPFFIVWRTISPRVAVVTTVVLVVMGIVGGYVADYMYEAEMRDMMEFLEQES